MLLATAVASGCTSTGSFVDAPLNSSGTVIEATDGDTFEVSINGTLTDLRLLGVDAPETINSQAPREFDLADTEENRECLRRYGERARQRAEELESSRVKLYQDSVQDRKGSYGRTLAYVYSSEGMLNLELLERGYARVYATEFEHYERFKQAERRAREQSIGLWSC